MIIRSVAILMATLCVLARGQEDSSLAVMTASLTVQTTPSGAKVTVDGSERGLTPIEITALLPGPHVLRIMHPDTASWLAGGALDTVVLGPGEERVLRYALGGWLLLNTVPSGAGVYIEDSLAGTTPLLLRQTIDPHLRVTVAREGYATVVATPEDFRRGALLVTLAPEAGGGTAMPPAGGAIVPPGPSPVPLYITGISAIVSGVAAAYCKAVADEASDEFLRSRDPALLGKRDRYDTAAAVSIAVMEASLGLLVYFLISR